MNTSYRFGIEEELFLADATTRGTTRRGVKAFHKDTCERLPKTERELLESQVEISSPPSTNFAETRSVLAGLRNDLANIERAHRVLVLAAGTHPMARWAEQNQTKKERYNILTHDMHMVARRNLVCGMHVHVEVPKPGQRVDLMNRLLPYMPLLLALSASSPFWQGRSTGLAAYRLSVWGEMPRTGLPDLFRSETDYKRYVATMVQSQAIADAVAPGSKTRSLSLRFTGASSASRSVSQNSIAGYPVPLGQLFLKTFGVRSVMASMPVSSTKRPVARKRSSLISTRFSRRSRKTRKRSIALLRLRWHARSLQWVRAPTTRSHALTGLVLNRLASEKRFLPSWTGLHRRPPGNRINALLVCSAIPLR